MNVRAFARLIEDMVDASRDDDSPITGINVTPLVDVTLVLLIVFLVTARLITAQAIPLDPPIARTPAMVSVVLAVAIDREGRMTLDGHPVASDAELVRAARTAFAKDPETRAVIHASQAASHGSVVRAMDALREGGIKKIAFSVSKTPSSSSSSP